jgi:hypothetical protein
MKRAMRSRPLSGHQIRRDCASGLNGLPVPVGLEALDHLVHLVTKAVTIA